MRNRAALRRLALSSVLVATVVACGSRTGLFGEDDINIRFEADASFRSEGGIRLDGGFFPDDAPNTLDVKPPVDVFRNDCPDADALLVYTITDDYELQSFNPDTGAFKSVGRISCPSPAGATPFSMAVDRRGAAFILFTDEHIYRASTATGACIATPYVPRQQNFARFGMGFATNSIGPTETLYIAGDQSNVGSGQPQGASGIASLDPNSFKLAFVGDDPLFESAELTGTGDGRLFAFYRHPDDDTTSYIGEVSTANGTILGERHFPTVRQGNGWAFAFWGGDFYMFHSPDSRTVVTRWRPSDDSVSQIATAPPGTIIVGAGVSTCAPQQ